MLIIIDFDRTLFDADSFKEGFIKISLEHGISREEFLKTYKESIREGDYYNPKWHIDALVVLKSKLDKKRLANDYNILLKDADKFLFLDSINFLKKIYEKNKLILLTYANEEFQKQKIERSGIKKYFEAVIITQSFDKTRDIEEIIKKHGDGRVIFIDDAAEAVDLVKEAFPSIVAIRIVRPGVAFSELPSKRADYIVEDLSSAYKVFK